MILQQSAIGRRLARSGRRRQEPMQGRSSRRSSALRSRSRAEVEVKARTTCCCANVIFMPLRPRDLGRKTGLLPVILLLLKGLVRYGPYDESKRNVREVALFCHIASRVARWHPVNGCPLFNEVRLYDFRSSRAPRPHRRRVHECPLRRRRVWWRWAAHPQAADRQPLQPISPSRVTLRSVKARST